MKREVMALPVVKKVPKAAAATPTGNAPPGPPAAPSLNFTTYQSSGYTLQYPDNWKQFGGNNSVAFGPEGGIVNDGSGHGAMAYGLTVGTAPSQAIANDSGNVLANATQQIVSELQQGNPNLKITRQPQSVKLNNESALSTYLSNDSPGGGQEIDWLVTVQRPEGVLYFMCTAPQNDFDNYHKTCNAILDSVRFNR
jgi:hypothetical protein